jgi:hypothetical protein
MNAQSKISKWTHFIVRSLKILLVFSVIALSLTATASQAKTRKTQALNPRQCVTQMCNKSTGLLGTLCTWKGQWDSVTVNTPEQLCTQVASIDICHSPNASFNATYKTCECEKGFTHRDNGIWQSLGCERCPANTTWDPGTKSWTCKDPSQMFDTYDLVCRPGPLEPPPTPCPPGMQANRVTGVCSYGCGDQAHWDGDSCVCNGANEYFQPIQGAEGYCQCAYLGNTGDNTPGCPSFNAPPPKRCPPGQVKSRDGGCISAGLPTTNPTSNSNSTNRSVPPPGLLETTPGLSPQGPAAVGTPRAPTNVYGR